jgi:hypothetical protein
MTAECLEAGNMRQSATEAVRERLKNGRRHSVGQLRARIDALEAELTAAREREVVYWIG